MARKKTTPASAKKPRASKKTKTADLPPLAVFLQDTIKNRPIPATELQRLSGVPDATLGRIIRGEVADPKASIVDKIARALGMHYWELSAIMGISGAEPGSPDQEAEQIGAILKRDESVRPLINKAIRLKPKSRAAVLAYIQYLEDQNDLRSPEEDQ